MFRGETYRIDERLGRLKRACTDQTAHEPLLFLKQNAACVTRAAAAILQEPMTLFGCDEAAVGVWLAPFQIDQVSIQRPFIFAAII